MRVEVEMISPISVWLGERKLVLQAPVGLTAKDLLLMIMHSQENYEQLMLEHGLYDGSNFNVLCLLENKIITQKQILDADCSLRILSPMLGG